MGLLFSISSCCLKLFAAPQPACAPPEGIPLWAPCPPWPLSPGGPFSGAVLVVSLVFLGFVCMVKSSFERIWGYV